MPKFMLDTNALDEIILYSQFLSLASSRTVSETQSRRSMAMIGDDWRPTIP
jgi:hypothetical protein